jgi:hypothetical protein
MDTMFSTTTSKSLCGNKCAQVFTNGASFDLFYHMQKKSEARGDVLNSIMIKTIGAVPKELVSDSAGEQEQNGRKTSRRWSRSTKFGTDSRNRLAPWQSRVESSIREIKRPRATMFRARSPKRLWDYCGEWVSTVRQLTAHDIPSLGGRVPSEIVEGSTPDISAYYAQFHWYEYNWFYNPTVQFPAAGRS